MKNPPTNQTKPSFLTTCALAVAAATLTVNAYAGGILNIENNAVIARGAAIGTSTPGVYDPVGSPTTGLYNGVEGLIQQGFWGDGSAFETGVGTTAAIVSGTAAYEMNTNGNFLYGVGAVDNNQVPNFGGILYGPSGLIAPDFAGVSSLTGAEILIKFTYAGDADLNGLIDVTDYSLIDNGFNSSLTGWLNGDFDHNGVVDITDYSLIDNAFNSQGAPLFVGGDKGGGGLASPAPVPEPGCVGLLLIGGLGLLASKCRPSKK